MSENPGPRTVMVVDDTPANLTLLQDMLLAEGYRVVAFPRGEFALRAAAKSTPDLILLDINMPEMDGFEVCARLKADPALRGIPVLFISALTDAQDKVKAFRSGGVDYVTKPFQLEEVKARVETHLRLRQLQLELESHNHRLEELVQAKVREISDSQMATIFALARLAESRDDDTGQHIARTRAYVRALAVKLQEHRSLAGRLDSGFIDTISRASPLHDIGKVGIPDAILLKPGRLTQEEFEVMKTHSLVGARTLQAARQKYPGNAFLNMGIAIARSHHERWDGSGYPDGLRGEDIPLSARIMAVADVYDALRSKRVYKPAFTHDEAAKIILEGRGSQFDPMLTETFEALSEQFSQISVGEFDITE